MWKKLDNDAWERSSSTPFDSYMWVLSTYQKRSDCKYDCIECPLYSGKSLLCGMSITNSYVNIMQFKCQIKCENAYKIS